VGRSFTYGHDRLPPAPQSSYATCTSIGTEIAVVHAGYRPRATRKGPEISGIFLLVDRALNGRLAGGLARGVHVGHAEAVAAPASTAPIPEASFDDLDLDREEDRVEWRRRLAELATARLSSARARFERLGIIDADGKLMSTELPPDMLPESDTTLETG
jgi:hypothetical protein